MLNDKLPSESRNNLRIRSRESVSIQIMQPNAEGLDTPRVVMCKTADISTNGLRIQLNEPLEAERIFDLCIELDFTPQYLLLIGETRWCNYNEQDNCYDVGLTIHDSEGSDYQEWIKLVGNE